MRPSNRIAGALAAAFFAVHIFALPASLEDLDSINFALGIRDYDVSRHQPHPPGYPLFILAAKIVFAVGQAVLGLLHRVFTEAQALGFLSITAGALAVIALCALFREWEDDRPAAGTAAWLAAVVAAMCPLFWLTASRPLSDMTGLAASLAVQVMLLRARRSGAVARAAMCAGLAAGIRSQVVWLTFPLLLLALVRLPREQRWRGLWQSASGYAAGALLWLLPLLWISGGPGAYWRAFANQGAEDLTGVAMLATTPTVRQLVKAIQYTFFEPWGSWLLAGAALALAAAGFLQMVWRGRPALLSLLVAFGPYLLFDLLFQESITTRYALPVVVPVAYLAVRGAFLLPRSLAIGAALTVIGFCVVIDDAVLMPFARNEAPSFRMLKDMAAVRRRAGDEFVAPVLAMHRRGTFDLRRPFQWMGGEVPPMAQRLSTPPKHEWLEVVRYWNEGGRLPVWFVADPLRSDLALFHTAERPVRYRWGFTPTGLLGGSRPSELDWYVMDRPEWYLGEGWSVTPETAGIAKEDRRGPGFAPITGWVQRHPGETTLMVGGRNLATDGKTAHVTVQFAGREVAAFDAAPGFFLRFISVAAPPDGPEFVPLTIAASHPEVAIEQFDAQPAERLMFGYGEGWYEHEYNPATGTLWRWASDRAVLRVRAGGRRVALTLRGEIEAGASSRVEIRSGDRVLASVDVGKTFTTTVVLPADALSGAETAVAIQSSAWYVPAERAWRSADQRRLALKIYECLVTPVS